MHARKKEKRKKKGKKEKERKICIMEVDCDVKQ